MQMKLFKARTFVLALAVFGSSWTLAESAKAITPGICERSKPIVQALESHLSKKCETITDEDLAELVALSFENDQDWALRSDDLDGFENLRSLDLSNTHLTGISDIALSQLSKIQFLYLANNRISKFSVSTFAGLVDLQTLSLAQNLITDIPANAFIKLGNLKSLYLTSNHLAEVGPAAFEGLLKLEILDLSYNNISSMSLSAFSQFSNLRYLYLPGNDLARITREDFGPKNPSLFIRVDKKLIKFSDLAVDVIENPAPGG
jgi:hypothetical protein